MPIYSTSVDLARTGYFFQANSLWVISCGSGIKAKLINLLNHNKASGGVMGIVMSTKKLELDEERM
jgi:hypothetical protein